MFVFLLKKAVVFAAVFFLLTAVSYSQNGYDYIFLENGTVLNFKTLPMTVERRGNITALSTVCDDNGSLLFYSVCEDFKYRVYNKDGKIIYTCGDVLGCITKYALISPYEDDTYYFISVVRKEQKDGSLLNHLLSVKIKGNAVTSTDIKGVACGMIPYVYGDKIYVICNNSVENCVDVYRIDEADLVKCSSYRGVTLPSYLDSDYDFTVLKFYNDVSKLVYERDDDFIILDFDVKNVRITGHKRFSIKNCYNFEFSNDGRFLYFCSVENADVSSKIDFFRVEASDFFENGAESVFEKVYSYSKKGDAFYVSMLLCKDGNIYFACFYDSKLSVIKNTDSDTPEFEPYVVDLGVGYEHNEHFPNIIRVYNGFDYVDNCSEFEFKYIGYPAKKIVWNFGDGSTVDGHETLSHVYKKAGKYAVTLNVFLFDGTERLIKKEINVNVLGNMRIEIER